MLEIPLPPRILYAQWACQCPTSVAAILVSVSEALFFLLRGSEGSQNCPKRITCSGDNQSWSLYVTNRRLTRPWSHIWGGANQVTHRRRPRDIWGELQQSRRCSQAKKCYKVCVAHLYVQQGCEIPMITSQDSTPSGRNWMLFPPETLYRRYRFGRPCNAPFSLV